MAFKRALWHSGLTYRQTCDMCHTVVQYTDEALDFRPWFADGFIYCQKCKKPLRHREEYAINGQDRPQETYFVNKNSYQRVNPDNPGSNAEHGHSFCTNCGKPFGYEDHFCSNCGNKR